MFIKGRKTIINMEAIKIIKVERYSFCLKVKAYDFDGKDYCLFAISGNLIKAITISKNLIEGIYDAKIHNCDVDTIQVANFFTDRYKETNKILTFI